MDGPSAPNTAQGGKWGQRPRNEKATWVKTRSLAGTTFTLLRANPAHVKGKESYVFEISGDRLFSATVGSTIFKQVMRDGIPPAGEYTIDVVAKDTQSFLVLRAL